MFVCRCFKPVNHKETFMKKYIVEWTSKAETKPGEHSEKAESFRENLWNEIQLKEPHRQK